MAERGADGAGQAFAFRELGVRGGATANPLARTAGGPIEDDQAVETKLLTGELLAGPRSGPHGHRESALQGTGRSSRFARRLGRLKGGLDIPATHCRCGSRQRGHPLRTLTHQAGSCAGRIGIFASHPIAVSLNDDRLPVMHQPVDQGPWPGCCPCRTGCPIPGTVDSSRARSSRFHNGRPPPGTTDRLRACRWADSPARRGGEDRGGCKSSACCPAAP